MTEFRYITYRKRPDKVAELILNRPEKLNAINDDMRLEMLAALDDAEQDDDVNVMIIKGAGQAFCSGHDLEKVGTYYGFEAKATAEKKRRPSQRVRLMRDRKLLTRVYHERFLFSWIPIVCQVHGYCVGGGMLLQLASDITIAADDARMGYTEQRLGFAGNTMDLALLTATIGAKKAQDLLLTSREITGKDASAMGLVSRSVPLEELDAAVEKCATTIARMPRDGIVMARAAKEMTYHCLGLTTDRITGYVTHSMFTNIRWEEDEFNFFKSRREGGTHDAIHDRNEFFGAEKKA